MDFYSRSTILRDSANRGKSIPQIHAVVIVLIESNIRGQREDSAFETALRVGGGEHYSRWVRAVDVIVALP